MDDMREIIPRQWYILKIIGFYRKNRGMKYPPACWQYEDMTKNSSGLKVGEPPKSLVAALRTLLRPLVRLLLAHGITLPALTALLKSLYVEVAEQEFPIPGKPQTDSRINLLTGVHRKDIRRLRQELPSDDVVPASVAVGTQLVAKWVGEQKYLDERGSPKALPIRKAQGREASFEQLVGAVVRQDLRPRVVLDELLRLGVVAVDGHCVRLNTEAFIPEKGFDEKAFYFGRNLRDHMATGVHNMLDNAPPLFERSVSYHKLGPASVKELNEMADQLGMQALKTINNKAMEMKRRDEKYSGEKQRINFGIYLYVGDDNLEPQEQPGEE